jgi:hypothetical protein
MNWKDEQCCGTCGWWDIEEARTASGAVPSRRPALCRWSWEKVELPKSVSVKGIYSLPRPSFMRRDNGKGCPCWRKR